MRRNKLGITVGYDADGNPKVLYCGTDYPKALEVYEKPPKGIRFVEFYRSPGAFRHRETEESWLVDAKRQEDAEKRSAEQRAAAEAKKKAEAEAKAAELKAATAKAQAKAATEAQSAHAKALTDQAETLERIAKEARKNAEAATKAAKE